MARSRASKRKTEPTYRTRLLEVIEASDALHTGRELAALAGLEYQTTIDALNALHNTAKVVRVGRKLTARWGRVPVELDENPAITLELAFRGFFK